MAVKEGLANAEEKVGTAFGDQALAEAAERHRMGIAQHELGKYEEARRHLVRAGGIRTGILGREHPDTLRSMNKLAALLRNQGEPKDAP